MIKLRMKFAGLANLVKKVLPFGNPEEQNLGTEQLEAMKERIEKARKILTDPNKTTYNLVLIPELMSIYESERSLDVLKEYSIPVGKIIVNQIIPENPNCGFCSGKRSQQLKRLETIRKRFSNFKIQEVRMFREEVKGFDRLERVAEALYSK